MYHGGSLDSSSAVDAAAATKNVMCLHMVQTDCVHQAGCLECMLCVMDAKLWSAVQDAKACTSFVPLFVSTAPSVKSRLGKLPWLLCS